MQTRALRVQFYKILYRNSHSLCHDSTSLWAWLTWVTSKNMRWFKGKGIADTIIVMWADSTDVHRQPSRRSHSLCHDSTFLWRGLLLHPQQALVQRHCNADTIAVMRTDAMLVGFKRIDRHTVSHSARRNASSLYTRTMLTDIFPPSDSRFEL